MLATKNVVYLNDYPVDARDTERFGMQRLRDAGISFEVWDVSAVFYEHIETLDVETPAWLKVRKIQNLDSFRYLLTELSDQCSVILLGAACSVPRSRSHRKLIRLLLRSPATVSAVVSGDIPLGIGQQTNGRLSRLKNGVKRVYRYRDQPVEAPKLVAKKLIFASLNSRILWHLPRPIRPLDYIYAGVSVRAINPNLITKRTRVTLLHTFDYELLRQQSPTVDTSAGYVLIDGMGPTHPDGALPGRSSTISTGHWCSLVNGALDQIERLSGESITVLAHPRARPGLLEELYGGRRIVYGKTLESVAQAKAILVVGGSTSLGWVAYFRKPLAILSYRAMLPIERDRSREWAQMLGARLYSIDGPIMKFIPSVDHHGCEQYVKSWLKVPGTLDVPFWDVVFKDLNIL